MQNNKSDCVHCDTTDVSEMSSGKRSGRVCSENSELPTSESCERTSSLQSNSHLPSTDLSSEHSVHVDRSVSSVHHLHTQTRGKECEDSGCDAVSDSVEPGGDGPKVVRGFSLDSFSGNSDDFEIVDSQTSACKAAESQPKESLPAQILPLSESGRNSVSTSGLKKENSDVTPHCSNSQNCVTQLDLDLTKDNSCHTISHPRVSVSYKTSISSVHIDPPVSNSKESVSNPETKTESPSHASQDPHSVPKIVIQQASVPNDSSNDSPDKSPASSSMKTVNCVSGSDPGHVSQSSVHKDISVLPCSHSASTTSDSTQKRAHVDSSQPDSTQLHRFSDMFVQKLLHDEAVAQTNGLSETSTSASTSSSLLSTTTSSSSSSDPLPSNQQTTTNKKVNVHTDF